MGKRRSKQAGQAVEVHIGELVLEGFPALHQAQLGAAVQQELARLLSQGGVPAGLAGSAEVASLDGGSFQLAPGCDSQAVGSQIAQAVYGGLRR